MKFPENILAVSQLRPDFMGFIFYPGSVRYVETREQIDAIKNLPPEISRVGVFVNHPLDQVVETCHSLGFEYAQLHGHESQTYLQEIKASGIGTIKVFHIDATFDWNLTDRYYTHTDYFLFDTRTPAYGGSGKQFNWEKLNQYSGGIPFFLSGGIGVGDLDKIKSIQHPTLHGVDMNSRLESTPAMKDVRQVELAIEKNRI